MDIIKQLQNFTANCLEHTFQLEIAPNKIAITQTKPGIDGDFTILLFPLLKLVNQAASELGTFLIEKIKESDKFEIYNIESAGGFLNITFTDQFWLNEFSKLNGELIQNQNQKKIIVEFSSPNTNKPLHLGHLRNIFLGDSMSRIYKAAGQDVLKMQVINDRGIAICKSMVAYQNEGNNEEPSSSHIKGDFFVGKFYVLFEANFKIEYSNWQNSEEAKQELLAKKEDESKAEFFANFKNQYFNKYSPMGSQARAMLQRWENNNEETLTLWKKLNGWVYEGFNETYANLDIQFDRNYYESDTYLLGKEMIQEGLDRSIFIKEDDSSVWVDLSDFHLDKKLLLRSDGTSVYITQDLGLAKNRYDDYHFDQMVYVVANEQDHHFKVLIKTLELYNPAYIDKLQHLSYGMVELPSGKMKSREGTVVDADELFDEIFQAVSKNSDSRTELQNLPELERGIIFRKVTKAALKYYLLKVHPKKKMLFDPSESVDIQGQTGPYILNAYVRIQSILRKADFKNESFNQNEIVLLQSEREIIKNIMLFGAVIDGVVADQDPSHLAHYLYQLAKMLHKYYHEVPVLQAMSKESTLFRLHLLQKLGNQLAQGMALLGIEMVDRM